MIRARFDSPWHDYRNVFDDLRNGKLSMAEYDIMVNEDALEADRRRAGLVVAVGIFEEAEADDRKSEETTEDTDRQEDAVCGCGVRITLDDSDEEITHCISLVNDKAVILIRNESSGAY